MPIEGLHYIAHLFAADFIILQQSPRSYLGPVDGSRVFNRPAPGAAFAYWILSPSNAPKRMNDCMGVDAMRAEAIAELGGSLIIAAITGMYTFGGLAMATYAFLAFDSSTKAIGLIPLLFGVVNFPIFVNWSRQTAVETVILAGSFRSNPRESTGSRFERVARN
jgi:hypothetical protein